MHTKTAANAAQYLPLYREWLMGHAAGNLPGSLGSLVPHEVDSPSPGPLAPVSVTLPLKS